MPTAPPPNAQPWEPTKLVAWLDRIEGAIERLNFFELLELPTTGSGEHVQLAYHQIARTRHPDLFRGRLTARDAERLMRVYGRIAAAYASLRDPNERTRYIYELRQHRSGRPSSAPPAPTAVADREGVTGLGRGTAPARAVDPARLRTAPPPPAVPRTLTPSAIPPRTLTPQQPIPPRTTTPQVVPPRTLTPQAIPPRTTTPQNVERPRTGSPVPPPGKSQPIPARGAPLSSPPPMGPPRIPPAAPTQMAPRALAFYRRAETALATGDVAAATLNLRMAQSADPTSELVRSALAEVQRGTK
jgi:hypothetical protein